jgi:hypothetical protein
MNFFKKLFGRKPPMPSSGLAMTESESQLLEQFTSLDNDSRLMQIITLGDHADMKSFKLLQYAILSDPDDGVKCAALKRIHLFKGHPDLIPMMTKLKASGTTEDLEPYFSMALNRLGLISLQEFEEKIKNSE